MFWACDRPGDSRDEMGWELCAGMGVKGERWSHFNHSETGCISGLEANKAHMMLTTGRKKGVVTYSTIIHLRWSEPQRDHCNRSCKW